MCIKPNNHKIRWVNCPVKWQNVDKRRTFLYCFDTKKDKILDNHLIYGLIGY
ncbi:hypothetical protein EJK51_1480 [Moraxella catarrhalis]|nr:hypothetical protein EJK52_1481 [Moraxella catarrhalis]AZQ92123.1 hypothetical protein EJK51_1480 [Moraxella catarrhalis]